ncbi:hypothetical protein DCAR_0100490 [Daucus carota subsp. sativus]|uniref:Uncharacterized protein n=1 Tax=Daucus carota subsp. sativus TaxID=79200 RepID=A0A166FPL0_DAUCS|nr:hypothetical protein DCAR_0100490 [Daucus carota subsp. sativus]
MMGAAEAVALLAAPEMNNWKRTILLTLLVRNTTTIVDRIKSRSVSRSEKRTVKHYKRLIRQRHVQEQPRSEQSKEDDEIWCV